MRKPYRKEADPPDVFPCQQQLAGQPSVPASGAGRRLSSSTEILARGFVPTEWEVQTRRDARLRGGLDFALHKRANVAHGDGEIVMGLQVNPELRSVAEIPAEA